jgi:hypothetical protein
MPWRFGAPRVARSRVKSANLAPACRAQTLIETGAWWLRTNEHNWSIDATFMPTRVRQNLNGLTLRSPRRLLLQFLPVWVYRSEAVPADLDPLEG